jgi:hypothetical protein
MAGALFLVGSGGSVMNFDRAAGIISIVLGLIAWLAPYKWPKVPRTLTDGVLFVAGIGLGIVASSSILPAERSEVRPAKRITDIPVVKAHTEVSMQFFAEDRAPLDVRRDNVQSWYAIWAPAIYTCVPQTGKKPCIPVLISRWWTIFIVFEKPTEIKQLAIDGTSGFPPYDVKAISPLYAVITTKGDISPGIVTIRSLD